MVPTSGRIVALDVGRRRVGVASASTVARLTSALPTLDMDDSFFDRLRDVVLQESAEVIVVGLPIGLNRRPTDQTTFVYNFIRELIIAFPTMKIETYEETLTSKQAEAELGASRKQYQKADVDARAAELILQGYLDSFVHTNGGGHD